MKAENVELKSDMKELKIQNAHQDDEILLLKEKILHLETLHLSTWAAHNSSDTDNGAFTLNALSTKALKDPPSSCQDLIKGNGLARWTGFTY